jgi:hypothetical protein
MKIVVQTCLKGAASPFGSWSGWPGRHPGCNSMSECRRSFPRSRGGAAVAIGRSVRACQRCLRSERLVEPPFRTMSVKLVAGRASRLQALSASESEGKGLMNAPCAAFGVASRMCIETPSCSRQTDVTAQRGWRVVEEPGCRPSAPTRRSRGGLRRLNDATGVFSAGGWHDLENLRPADLHNFAPTRGDSRSTRRQVRYRGAS